MLPIFVVHYDKLTDRYDYLKKNIPFAQFITEPQDNLEDTYFKYHNDPKLWKERTSGLYGGEVPFRELKHGDKACFHKHMEALTKAYIYNTLCLILEDDAVLKPNFWKCFEHIFRKDVHLWDILFIGGAFHHTVAPTISMIEDSPIVLKGHPCSNTVSAYIVKPRAAIALTHFFSKNGFTLPVDFEYNYAIKELGLRPAHYLPYMTYEGSSAGIYKGTQTR